MENTENNSESTITSEQKEADQTVQIPETTGKRKKKKKHVWVVFVVIAVLLIILLAAAGLFIKNKVSNAKDQATQLKEDLETVLEYTKAKDIDNAETALQKTYEDREQLETTLADPFWTYACKISRVDKELSAGKELLTVIKTAQDDLLAPLINLMKEKPLSDLKVGEDGFNVDLINSYLDFAEEIQPKLNLLIDEILQVDTDSMVGGYVDKYKDKLYEYTDAYKEASAMLPFLRTFLGNGEDRLYLFVAQNSAEIRASGGFPGSIGTIQIKDGVLTIGDFESVYDVLASVVSTESGITDSEVNVFGGWIFAPRDACFFPAFDRAAEIWAIAYEDKQREEGAFDDYAHFVKKNSFYDAWNDEYYYYGGIQEADYYNYYTWPNTEYVNYVDGVVSLTPAIIQMLLKDIGELTLADGTVLDSTNATKVLQHDLYHKYFENDNITGTSNSESDALFAETAKSVMKEFVSNFEISKFADYYALLQEASEKNILNVWMTDEEEEEIIIDTGFSGKLNFDPEQPFTGIYFSLADPSKLGWYLDIDTEIGEPVINEDGTRTYDVTVTLRNNITEEDIENSHQYIIGAYNGSIRGFLHCFAPAGGYISDVQTSNWMYMFEANYDDLEVYYDLDVLIDPGEEIQITYKATTAEGVETPLKAITTPTLTEYR